MCSPTPSPINYTARETPGATQRKIQPQPGGGRAGAGQESVEERPPEGERPRSKGSLGVYLIFLGLSES